MQRRRERRYEVSESVVLKILGQAGPEYAAGTIMDISRSGYRVVSGTKLAVGTEVLTTLHAVAIIGRVRHCEPFQSDSFTIGVEITRVVGAIASRAIAAHRSDDLANFHASPIGRAGGIVEKSNKYTEKLSSGLQRLRRGLCP